MWCDHPFSQRNRRTERTVGVEVGGYRKMGERGLTKFEKGGGGGGVSNVGDLHKKGG